MSESTVEIPVIDVTRIVRDPRTSPSTSSAPRRASAHVAVAAAAPEAPRRRGAHRAAGTGLRSHLLALFGAGWDLDWDWPRLVERGDMATVVASVVDGALARRSSLLLTLNLDIWRQLASYRRHRLVRPEYHCVLLDGAPIVWAYKRATRGEGHRITGADLLPALTRAALREGLHVHFSGGAPGVADRVAALFADADGSGRVSSSSYPIRPDLTGLDAAAREITALRPDIVFAAYGFPKQDALGSAILATRAGITVIGCGAAFDFALGRFQRAPMVVQALRMEWLMRLLQEPRRLASRYLLHDVPAVLPLVRAAHRLRRRNDQEAE